MIWLLFQKDVYERLPTSIRCLLHTSYHLVPAALLTFSKGDAFPIMGQSRSQGEAQRAGDKLRLEVTMLSQGSQVAQPLLLRYMTTLEFGNKVKLAINSCFTCSKL